MTDEPADPAEELSLAVRRATMVLADAGIPSAPVDALVLAGHLLGVDTGEARRLMILRATPAPAGYAELVATRATRVPLQHLTGVAHFRSITLAVGPGVFVPRPETERLVDHALQALDVYGVMSATVVDLCAGSGAVALAIAAERPGTRVLAVEISPEAHAWAQHNIDLLGLAVELHLGDATQPMPDLEPLLGLVDVVTANPPYIPMDAVPVDPEVRDHDPETALYGGPGDGLGIPLAVAEAAARLLRPGGRLVMEHADTQGQSLVRRLAGLGPWSTVSDHADLAGKPRHVVAIRGPRPSSG